MAKARTATQLFRQLLLQHRALNTKIELLRKDIYRVERHRDDLQGCLYELCADQVEGHPLRALLDESSHHFLLDGMVTAVSWIYETQFLSIDHVELTELKEDEEQNGKQAES